MLKYKSNLFFVSLLVVQFCCTTAKKDSASLRHELEGYVDVSDDVRLFYRLLGSGPDTIIMIHGGPGFTMDYFLEDLAPLSATHTLIFYDQRGTGRSTIVSDSAALDVGRFVNDLEALRRHFGLQRLTLFGHSWGSAVVALYAVKYPKNINKLIIIGALPLQHYQLMDAFNRLEASRDSSTLQRMVELREARLADPGNADLCREYYELWFEAFYGDRNMSGHSKGDFCTGTSESRRNKMTSVDRFTMASLGQWDWRLSLSQVPAPTLVIHGVKDPLPLEGAKAWAAVLPNCRLLALEGVGHFPYLEVPDRFFEAVNQFLQEN
jgi:proline iminopeptidase